MDDPRELERLRNYKPSIDDLKMKDPNFDLIKMNEQISYGLPKLSDIPLNDDIIYPHTFINNLKYWFICKRKGHIVSRIHPKYPSHYCSICHRHKSEF